MINPKDLRIGNIVTYRIGENKTSIPMMVVAIYENEVDLDFDGNEGDAFICTPDELVGIPVTTEILEKNGFKLKEDGELFTDYWLNCGDAFDTGLVFTLYKRPIGGVTTLLKISVSCKSGSGLNSVHHCDIHSIHELQNCLQILGVDKEIKV